MFRIPRGSYCFERNWPSKFIGDLKQYFFLLHSFFFLIIKFEFVDQNIEFYKHRINGFSERKEIFSLNLNYQQFIFNHDLSIETAFSRIDPINRYFEAIGEPFRCLLLDKPRQRATRSIFFVALLFAKVNNSCARENYKPRVIQRGNEV